MALRPGHEESHRHLDGAGQEAIKHMAFDPRFEVSLFADESQFPQLVNPDTGRVHTCFNQAVAATGRLSSSDPNLQNIPIRTELGREIRRAFIADPGNVLISADYSQIELRVLAHLAGEEALIEAFQRGEDIHDRTAAKVFGQDSGLDRHELRRLIEERLRDSHPPTDPQTAVPAGFSAEVDAAVRQYFPASPAAAAVLVPLVDHEDGLTVLLTQRASHLTHHGGQISFPGGRMEPGDEGPLAAALRETQEEIGLDPRKVTLAGYLHDHLVITGFRVTPVVGFVSGDFHLELDRTEVDEAFEVPLSFLLDPANQQRHFRMLGTTRRDFWAIPYRERYIWGATAAMLLILDRTLRDTGP